MFELAYRLLKKSDKGIVYFDFSTINAEKVTVGSGRMQQRAFRDLLVSILHGYSPLMFQNIRSFFNY